MAFKLKYKNLEGVVDQLRGAVKAHAKQADIIQDHIDEMEEESAFQKTSPMKNYRNPQDYKVFNFGNEPTPFEKQVPNCVPRGSGSKRLSKPADDPCWEDYVQRGMKEK